jgi:DNA-binding NtrC family response regulator
VRQLRNEIQRAVALGQSGRGIGPEHLSPEIVSASIRPQADTGSTYRKLLPVTSLADAVDGLEREIIEATLQSEQREYF